MNKVILKPGDVKFTLPLDANSYNLRISLLKCYRNYKGVDEITRKYISKRNANLIDNDVALDGLFNALSDRGEIDSVYFSLVNAETCDIDGILKYGWIDRKELNEESITIQEERA
jgi:hypothetical protein